MSAEDAGERLLRGIFEHASGGLVLLRAVRDEAGAIRDFEVRHRNAAARGIEPLAEGAAAIARYRASMTDERARDFEERVQIGHVERRFRVRVTVVGDDLALAFTDVTATDHQAVWTDFLGSAVAAIAASLDADVLLDELARSAVPKVADWCAIDLLEEGRVRRAAVGHPSSRDRAIALDWWNRFPDTDPVNAWIYELAVTRRHGGIVAFTEDVFAHNPNREMVAALRELAVREAITVPIARGDRFFGALTLILSDSGRSFDERDVEHAEELGNRIGIALENARLFALERSARAREAKLHELSAALSKASSPDEVARVACRLGADASGAPAGALWLVTDGRVLSLVGHWGFDAAFMDQFRALPANTSVGVASSAPIWVETEDDYVRLFPVSAGKAAAAGRLESIASIPLAIGERVLGLMSFSYRRWKSFPPEERALLTTLGDHCAQAFERALLHARLAQAAARDRFLASIFPTLGEAHLELGTVLEGAAALSAKAFHGTAVLRLAQGEGGTLEAVARCDARAASREVAAESLHPIAATDEGVEARSYRSRSVVVDRAVGVICAPLVSRDVALGTLSIWAREGSSPLDDQAAAMLEEAASRIALVIDNARLFADAKRSAHRAEDASRFKDEFLATVSHELRTPLNAILGWASLLREDASLSEKARKGLSVIHRNAQSQTRIIEDILDVSRIITGKLLIEPRPADLGAIAAQALEVVAASAAARKITLSFAPPAHPLRMVVDPDRVQQVIWNLLSNAIKFTEAGGTVTLAVAQEGATATVEVTDSGRGIEPAFLPFVFERFRQADSSTTRSFGGLGLGLAIVRHIVELHGGHVEATSPGLGQGATFKATFPVRAVAPPASRPQGTPVRDAVSRTTPTKMFVGLVGIRVLVVDDEADARELLEMVLGQAGATVESAGSAEAALAACSAFRPDVLVSDIGMPGRDGYALIRDLRARGVNDGGTTPAIALTAYARADDRDRALAAGFDVHLGKPVDPDELLEAVARLVRG